MLGGIAAGSDLLVGVDSQPAGTLLPLGGISGSVTVLCNESGEYVIYNSDEHGFRNPVGTWSADRAQLAVVGQSFAQGYCVPDGRTFVDRLRPRYGVTLNLGISGGAPMMQLAAIREYLPRYAPARVLWIFTERIDLDDAQFESRHPWLSRYLEPSFTQHLLGRQREIDYALRAFVREQERRSLQRRAIPRGVNTRDKWLVRFKLWDLREKIQLAYGIPRSDPPDASFDLLRQTLVQADAATKAWGGQLYFVYLPSWTRFRNGRLPVERERTRVFDIVKTLGVPIIDVRQAFERSPDPLSLFPFRRFGHFNERGNELVARTVLEAISAHEGGRPAAIAGREAAGR
jgi:hypothetical protein